jgi:small subunit ribosomal protein S6
MHQYEMMVMLFPELSEEEINKVREKIKNFIEEHGGTVEKEEIWGLKRLAYEIKHRKEAYYFIVYFNSPPDVPLSLRERLNLDERVMRYLIEKKDH